MSAARRDRPWGALLLSFLICVACDGQEPAVDGGDEVTSEVAAEVEQFLTEQVDGGSFNDRGQRTVTGESTASITIEEFAFAPTVLVGAAGQELEVTLVNEGDGPHTFTIDNQEVNVALRREQSGEATVTFPDTGEPVLFYCRFHRAQGMVGALTEAPSA